MELLYQKELALQNAPLNCLHWPAFNSKKIGINVLRLDELHPVISGNKYFKLKYYLQQALLLKKHTLVSFGGAFSNHLVAMAYAANRLGLNSVGIVRGEQPEQFSRTLITAQSYGMMFQFISRSEYRNKQKYITEYEKREGCYVIAEGGEGVLGIQGASEILDSINKEAYSHIICAVGTGTMLKGLHIAVLARQKIIGIPVLKAGDEWFKKLKKNDNLVAPMEIFSNYHEGGYARKNEELLHFMNHFYAVTNIPTDFVYTGKLMKAVLDLVEKDNFPSNSNLLVIHSGGLQGNASLPPGQLVYA